MPPHRFGTISHESRALGLMAHRAPMMEPSATSAAAAMKSGGQGMRSASSMIQARSASGNSVSASNGGTGLSSATMGFGLRPRVVAFIADRVDRHGSSDSGAHRLHSGVPMQVVEVGGSRRPVAPEVGDGKQCVHCLRRFARLGQSRIVWCVRVIIGADDQAQAWETSPAARLLPAADFRH